MLYINLKKGFLRMFALEGIIHVELIADSWNETSAEPYREDMQLCNKSLTGPL